jgi:hypothetical protein
MGQQTTIAYIAPDSSSQMTFTVQKADGTCVGSDCSTYLTDWADGSGSSVNWAANLSPSLNSQMTGGQHWTMTIQNAGLGYNGFLSSPSGKKLPAGGAQFKLMTQNEINDQPPWAVALEKIGGEVLALVGITILTAGTGDAALVGAEMLEGGVDEMSVLADDGSVEALDAENLIGDETLEQWAEMNNATRNALMDSLLDSVPAPVGNILDELDVIDKVVDPLFEGDEYDLWKLWSYI